MKVLGLELHEGEKLMTEFSFLDELSCLLVKVKCFEQIQKMIGHQTHLGTHF